MAAFEYSFTDEELAREEWRAIPGFEGCYEVSSLGRVKRIAAGSGTQAGRILSPVLDSAGYIVFALSGMRIGRKQSTYKAHRLTAAAFIGAPPPRLHVNHLDGVKTNNRVGNLEYCTPRENTLHAARLGLMASGERHGFRLDPTRAARGERAGRAKLTPETAIEVHVLWRAGWTQRAIGRRYGISKVSVAYVVNFRSWTHLG
jgi:hypothetical protein